MIRPARLGTSLLFLSTVLGASGPAPAGKGAVSAEAALATATSRYEAAWAPRLVPLLSEVLRFETVQGNEPAHAAQRAWILRVGQELGLVVRDKGLVTEVELPGPPGAPVLGLMVHGDVQPADPAAWRVPPFAGLSARGYVHGRGSADDKGPLVQALLAMKSLSESGLPLTHTVRLLVGSDEESKNLDVATYLKGDAAPDYTLVLDSSFPVVVGELAWNALSVTADLAERAPRPPGAAGAGAAAAAKPWEAVDLSAGLAYSIVPDRAVLTLRWKEGTPDFAPLISRLRGKRLPEGIGLSTAVDGPGATLTLRGRSAHAGMNLSGGRNALVALAVLMEGELSPCGADDLLAFARLVGADLTGRSLGLPDGGPPWGGYLVNVATVFPGEGDWGLASGIPKERARTLTVNFRRPPPLTGADLRQRLAKLVADANAKGAELKPSGFFDDEPLVLDPKGKLVTRLLQAYRRATGTSEGPAVSGGGSYAKRLPRSVAFGMWFPGKPYPGHDADEQVPIADLHRGVRVLLAALVDLAGSAPIAEPMRP